jgi:hypothetical protein
MGEARRRKLAAGTVDRSDAVRRFAKAVLCSVDHTLIVAVGPVVWDVTTGHDVRHWFFMVGSCDANGAFRIDQFKIVGNNLVLAEQCRDDLITELGRRKPITIYTFDDELAMMQFCEAAWPSERTHKLRASIEQEGLDPGGACPSVWQL